MRLSKYISEATLDANELKREIQKVEKMEPGEDKDEAVITLMGELDKVRNTLEKGYKIKAKSKEWKEFDRAYEPAVNAIASLADPKGKVKTNHIMNLYQKWINVTNGILNKRKK
jgi:hypothetical protein